MSKYFTNDTERDEFERALELEIRGGGSCSNSSEEPRDDEYEIEVVYQSPSDPNADVSDLEPMSSRQRDRL